MFGKGRLIAVLAAVVIVVAALSSAQAAIVTIGGGDLAGYYIAPWYSSSLTPADLGGYPMYALYGMANTTVVGYSRSLLKADLSSLPAGPIVVTHAYFSDPYTGFTNVTWNTVYAGRIAQAWTPGQVSWTNATAAAAWTTPGVDVSGTPTATTDMYNLAFDLAADVQFFHDNPTQNFGWVLYNNGNPDPNSSRWDIQIGGYAWPSNGLTIEYTEVPEPMTMSLLALGGGLALLRRRR